MARQLVFSISGSDSRLLASEIMLQRSRTGCSLSVAQRIVFDAHHPGLDDARFHLWLTCLQSTLASFPGRKRGPKPRQRRSDIGFREVSPSWGLKNQAARLAIMASVSGHLRLYLYLHGHLPPFDVLMATFAWTEAELLAGIAVLESLGFELDLSNDPRHTVIGVTKIPDLQRFLDGAIVFAVYHLIRASSSGDVPLAVLASYVQAVSVAWDPSSAFDVPPSIAAIDALLAERQASEPRPDWMGQEVEPPT